jgi:hypothetical protein
MTGLQTPPAASLAGCIAALVLLVGISSCSDSPTSASDRVTLTEGSIYENGQRILRVRRDAPSRNVWFYRPDAEVGSRPPEGAEAPSLVSLRVTDFPEAAGSNGDWMSLEVRGRGLSVPIQRGSYPIAFVSAEEELADANLGVLRTELRMGKGIGGLTRIAHAVSGELTVTRILRDPPPSRRAVMEGRIVVDLVDQNEGPGATPTLRADFHFRSVYSP